MKVLVTGGSGFVGREILGRLRKEGHAACLLVRDAGSPRARALVAGFGGELRQGDVGRPDSLVGAARGCDAVIHLVGIIGEVGANTFTTVHVDGTANVLREARRAGARRWIHMSALGTRAGARSRYHQTKWAAEQLVRQSGLEWTLFRPSLIYGPGDAFVNLFARLSRWSPILPVMGSGQGKLQPVAVEEVARCFVRALDEPASTGQTYDLCGPTALTYSAVLDEILAVTGRRRLKVRIPLGLARMQAWVLEAVWPRLLGRAAPLNREQLLMLEEDNVGDPGPARRLFGLQSESFRAGIARFLARGAR